MIIYLYSNFVVNRIPLFIYLIGLHYLFNQRLMVVESKAGHSMFVSRASKETCFFNRIPNSFFLSDAMFYSIAPRKPPGRGRFDEGKWGRRFDAP